MANTEVINLIIETASEMFIYVLPIIGIMTIINFLATMIYSITFGSIKHIGK